ncbi:hypothetical protein L6164_020375 [Bauhinia variegata]|uniref:Uncharacterized protein n=1 Tax=Bauhinia variegata TaxID=167791 RepID=A0ACB9MUU4_BAUVA|nr:hypothetical protein L6164_020375 [Bauhinia variegata]
MFGAMKESEGLRPLVGWGMLDSSGEGEQRVTFHDGDSMKLRISLSSDLESVIWSMMISEGRSEARLWICNRIAGDCLEPGKGVKALSQFSFRNRDICWEELERKGNMGGHQQWLLPSPTVFLIWKSNELWIILLRILSQEFLTPESWESVFMDNEIGFRKSDKYLLLNHDGSLEEYCSDFYSRASIVVRSRKKRNIERKQRRPSIVMMSYLSLVVEVRSRKLVAFN